MLGGVPLAIMVLLGLLTLGPNMRRTPRYRPGDAWNHPPVWWTANQALQDSTAGQHGHAATGAARGGCRGDW